MKAEREHLLVGEQREAGHGALGLDLVQLVIAGDEQHDQVAVGVLARKRLHGRGRGDVEELRKILDGVDAGRRGLLHAVDLVNGRACQAVAGLGVGGVSAGAMHELGFARFGERHELGGHLAADLAGVRLDGR